jgi:hypothetical protein
MRAALLATGRPLTGIVGRCSASKPCSPGHLTRARTTDQYSPETPRLPDARAAKSGYPVCVVIETVTAVSVLDTALHVIYGGINMAHDWWLYLVWVLAAGLLGFLLSALFAGWMGLPRRFFLVPYVGVTGAFLYLFLAWSGIDSLSLMRHNWAWGLVAALITGAMLVKNVRSGPVSRQSTGTELALDVTWLGLAYGAIDGLFLNVMPILAVWEAFAQIGWTDAWLGKIAVGALGLAASLLVTLAYHVGYPEFRNARVGLVLFGNGIISLAYLASANPLGGVISHVAMHVAAVFQGPETTLQLPPHQKGLAP